MKCKKCGGSCRKKGKVRGKQRWLCKSCGKTQFRQYKRTREQLTEENLIRQYNAENVGIRGMARMLDRSPSFVVSKIKELADQVKRPARHEQGEEYELDEVWAKTLKSKKGKRIWVMWAINRRTREVVDIVVGRRTKKNMRKLIKRLEALNPKTIRTDRWPHYKKIFSRFPEGVHRPGRRRTNKIERQGLTLRCHVKRLNRKTISYSKSVAMLEAILLLYMDHRNWCLSGLTRR